MMKVYAINLKSDQAKRTYILNECRRHDIGVEIFDAVDGKTLSEEFLEKNVFNYKRSWLPKAVIGCVLSHLSIYKRMMEKKEGMVLILEDDAVISKGLHEAIKYIERIDDSTKPNVYLMSTAKVIYKNPHFMGNGIALHKTIDAMGAHGYILNLAAAELLLKLNTPVRFETDLWKMFKQFSEINIFSALPVLIMTNDETKERSSLEKDRAASWENRKIEVKKLRRRASASKKIKWTLLKLLRLTGVVKTLRVGA